MWIKNQDGNLINLERAEKITKENHFKKWVVAADNMIIQKFDTEKQCQKCIDNLEKELKNGADLYDND